MAQESITPMERVVPDSMEQVRLSFAPVVAEVAPAVVNIFSRRSVERRSMDPFFERFFGQMGPREQSSLGSGVIVGPDGVVITNNHVIEGMTEIKVVLNDRREYEAELILADPKTDLAVLQIEPESPLPFLEFANSDAIDVGDVVLAIGNPFGVGQTVTSGIVSALARTAVSISDYQFFIQTDAAINPGNSGGALVDIDGNLIGINTAIYTRTGESNGIGFAIPSRLVQQVLFSALNGGELVRPWLGASTQTVTADLSRALNLDRPSGALIEELWPDGPAAKSGLKPGDVITAFDGQPVYDAGTLRFRVGVANVEAPTPIRIRRNGEEKELTIRVEPPPEKPAPDTRLLRGNHPLNGVTISNLSPRYNEEAGIDPLLEGVIVEAVPGRTYAARSGLRKGYRILSVNGDEVKTTQQLEKSLLRAGGAWSFEIDTGRRVVSWQVGR